MTRRNNSNSRCHAGTRGGELEVAFEAAHSEHGLEFVEIQVTTIPKCPSGSLASIASGGERALASPAVSVIAAHKTRLSCLVFEEVDVGVDGTEEVVRLLAGTDLTDKTRAYARILLEEAAP